MPEDREWENLVLRCGALELAAGDDDMDDTMDSRRGAGVGHTQRGGYYGGSREIEGGGIVIAGDEEIVNDRHSSLSLSSLLPCNH